MTDSSTDRPVEIEITPEMIEAGVAYAQLALAPYVPPSWSLIDLFVADLLRVSLSGAQ